MDRGKGRFTKEQASQAAVSLHPVLAGHMNSWHKASPYAEPSEWVFASFKLKGRKPRVANMPVADHLRPAYLDVCPLQLAKLYCGIQKMT